MTTKAKADDKPAEETKPQAEAKPAAACGKPHHLPMLASHVACQLPAKELELGEPEHEHRHQDGDAIYVWR